MPSASRNANKKRRARRNITLLTRAAQSEAINRAKTMVVLCSVLNKLGGEIEVSKADIDGAAKNLTQLSFVVEPSAVEGHFMVKLVAQPQASEPVELTGSDLTAEEPAPVDNGPTDAEMDAEVGEARAIADDVPGAGE